MAQHTPEPWEYVLTDSIEPDTDAWVVTSDESDVAEVTSPGSTAKANARRIVACVNALQGAPTDYLERLKPGALTDMIEGLID